MENFQTGNWVTLPSNMTLENSLPYGSSRWGMGCEGLSQGHKAGQEDSELPNLGHRQLHLPVLVGKSLSDFSRNGLC